MTDTIDSEATATAHAIADLAMAGGSTQRVAMCLARLARIAQQIPSDSSGSGLDSDMLPVTTPENSSPGLRLDAPLGLDGERLAAREERRTA